MASLKDIKRRIKSVKNTKKTTYAMKLVSAAKLRRAQDAVVASREYTDILTQVVGELASQVGSSDISHPLMEQRSEVKRIRVLVVGASRGLCGGYNANVERAAKNFLQELASRDGNPEVEVVVFGKKPRDQLSKAGIEFFEEHVEDLSEEVSEWPIEEACRTLELAFLRGEIDEAHVLYTRFKSPVSMKPVTEQLLPMTAGDELQADETASTAPKIFEPSAEEVFEAVIPRILRTRFRQACLDSKAGEHGSRMVAMDNATKNAGELVESLTLKHNKLRQSAITGELLDIVGGAEALNN